MTYKEDVPPAFQTVARDLPRGFSEFNKAGMKRMNQRQRWLAVERTK